MLSKLLPDKEPTTNDVSGGSFQYSWKIDEFKDWHKNLPKKYIASPYMNTSGEKGLKFQMWLLSNGLDQATGRVNLTLYLEYFTKKFFKLIPVEVKVSVIDENGVKRHTQEFIMAAFGVPRSVHVARYFYRTKEDDLKSAENSPFYLIINNEATFHFEMRYLNKDQFNERMELYRKEAKEAKVKKAATKKATAPCKVRRPILPKLWHAIRNLSHI